MQLSHIWLLVEDIARAKGFYRDTLGIELLNDLGEYVEFQVNQQSYLALFTRAAMQAGEPAIQYTPVSGQRAVLAFEVGDVDGAAQRLRAQGATLTSDAANHPEWGLRTIFLNDPDGNLICLYGGIPA
jgi:catechol 2,3-dioxygenase-like lactoylglutathione lyase family enzyme